jgi:hypothetical protein
MLEELAVWINGDPVSTTRASLHGDDLTWSPTCDSPSIAFVRSRQFSPRIPGRSRCSCAAAMSGNGMTAAIGHLAIGVQRVIQGERRFALALIRHIVDSKKYGDFLKLSAEGNVAQDRYPALRARHQGRNDLRNRNQSVLRGSTLQGQLPGV